MHYEWDEIKREANLIKHGVDFTEVFDFDWNKAIHEPDARNPYGEQRIVSFAPIRGRIHVMVWTLRGDAVRIIGLRKANTREVSRYETQA